MREPANTTPDKHGGGGRTTSDLGALADPAAYTEPIEVTGENPERLRDQLERMLLIRHVEEVIGELVESGEVGCPCHLAVGQEAVAVGAAAAFRPGDKAYGAHRSHAHYLALGGDPEALLAEILGKATGCSGGMGGSMHLCDPPLGLLGTVPIVGATIPIAVGTALAARTRHEDSVVFTFFGDGATDEGVFHESLNLASLWRLPVVFVCENNLFSSHLHIRLRQVRDSVARFADANDIPAILVDGNDVVAMAGAARHAVAHAREGQGPFFLEAITYRWRGHVGPRSDDDVGLGRSEELVRWKERDPIRRLASALESASLMDPREFESTRQRVTDRVSTALAAARSAPYPTEHDLRQLLYTTPARRR